jgi:hypothetical protein
MASCVAGDDSYQDGSSFFYVVLERGAGRSCLIVDGYEADGFAWFTITGLIV